MQNNDTYWLPLTTERIDSGQELCQKIGGLCGLYEEKILKGKFEEALEANNFIRPHTFFSTM